MIVCILIFVAIAYFIINIVTTFYGNPFTKITAKKNINKYIHARYSDELHFDKVGYNFKTNKYVARLMTKDGQLYTTVRYYGESKTIQDDKDEEWLNNYLKDRIVHLAEEMNIPYQKVSCEVYPYLKVNQDFSKSPENIERGGSASIKLVNNADFELDKDHFAALAADIIKDLKKYINLGDKDKISITCQSGEGTEIKSLYFYVQGNQGDLSKEYILKHTEV